jgi:HlyD family secretion protein
MISTTIQQQRAEPAQTAPALPLEVRRPAPRAVGRRPWRARLMAASLVGAAFVAGAVFATIQSPSFAADIAGLLSGSSVAPGNGVASTPVADPIRTVLGLARLMPEGDLIRVSPPYGAGDARIAVIHVAVGDRVEAGDLLATLDNAAALESARLAAEAVVAQREAALVQARRPCASGCWRREASVAEARGRGRCRASRLDRGGRWPTGVVTAATLDDLEAEARRRLRRWPGPRPRSPAGIPVRHRRAPDVVVAQAALDAARIDLDRAVRDLAKSEVRAPIAGVVLEIGIRPGERPGSEGLMTLGRTDRMMALVEVFQTEIGRVRVGPGGGADLCAAGPRP